ncbi:MULTISPECIES: methyl-accepting chemotaxis protein [Planktothrix]|uniref:methyl-accepting chemotaxis protein n=1 Tax=Planktothrix TaxID=54304 RepID=UPI0003F732A2|nr:MULTISPECIES: methyl-accepting chemotaxis protein [Planktothrix]CAD0229186.1 Chemotaxis sensory transducer [Planktothrix agardhii]
MANNFDKNLGDKKHLLSQFKLRTQMLFGYAIPVFMFAVSTYIVYSNANKVFEAFNQVENVQKNIIETDTMALSGSNMVANSRGHLISEESQFLELYQQSWQNFQEASNNVDNTITVDEQRKRFEQMNEIAKNYNQYQNKLVSFLEQGKRKEALELFKAGIGSKLLSDFLTLNSEFNGTEIKRLNTENIQARNTLQNAINLLVFGSIISALTAFIIAWLISSLVSRKITQAIDAIDNSSLEINIAVDQQEKITSSQASSVNETTRTMDELEFSAKQASEQAETSTVGARQVLNLAENGNELVKQTLVEMNQMKEKVEAIAEQILRLSEQTNQIGNISQLVGDLANQTNMLALNAAVEAVRAGEYGKGFSVVASEIRKLADESQKSAHQINNLVMGIKQSNNLTGVVTEAGIKSVENTLDLAQKTASAFNNMSSELSNIVQSSQQISLNSKQQAVAIQQVVVAMNNLNKNAQDSSQGMGQIKLGIKKLSDAAFDLKDIVQETSK